MFISSILLLVFIILKIAHSILSLFQIKPFKRRLTLKRISTVNSQNLDIFYRYIALCAPFVRLKYNFKAMAYMMPILIFVPLYNIPRFFESKSIVSKKYYCIDYLGTADFTQEDLGIVHHMFSRILNHEIFFVLFFYEVEVFD